MVQSTRVNGINKVEKMVGVFKFGLTDLSMRVTGKVTKQTEGVD